MRVAAVACALGLLLPSITSLVPAGASGSTAEWLLDLACHWQWLFALGLALAAAPAAIGDRRWACLAALLILPWVGASPLLPAATTGDNTFSIASANVHMDNLDARPLAEWLSREKPDVVVVLEITEPYAQGLQGLDSYPYRHVETQDNPFGIAVLSRHPFNSVATRRDADGIPHIEARIAWQGGEIALVVAHPMPPISARYAAARNAKLAQWSRAAAASGMPALIAGDLNATPWSSAFNGLDAAGMRRATGLAPTWPAAAAGLTGVPIDHVLASKHWERVDSVRGPDLGSDHYPVLARLRLSARH